MIVLLILFVQGVQSTVDKSQETGSECMSHAKKFFLPGNYFDQLPVTQES